MTNHSNIVEIENLLSNGIYKVTYTSEDGYTYTSICTRDFDWLSSDGIADEMGWIEPNGDRSNEFVVNAWDVEDKGWCSFNPDNIEDIEFFSPTKDEDIIEDID